MNKRTAPYFILIITFIGLCVTSAALSREMIAFSKKYRPGTIVISNHERRLYLVLGGGRAIRYKVAVGKRGKQWRGKTYIDGKYRHPAWSPPASVKRDLPHLPNVIPPGPYNPMGVAALTLAGDEYAIHGTNRPKLIGRAVSYGCIRMYNHDISDLFKRVKRGTPVVVVP